MLHELFTTYFTNSTSILNPFTFINSEVNIGLLELKMITSKKMIPFCEGIFSNLTTWNRVIRQNIQF